MMTDLNTERGNDDELLTKLAFTVRTVNNRT